MEKKLTVKQQRFVNEYLKTGNGTQSAIKAGYSKHTAREIAKENIAKPYIKEIIEKVMIEEAEKMGITAEYVLGRIKWVADKDDDKLIPSILKAAETFAKILDLFPNDKMDVTLKEHRDTLRQLEELE